MEKSVEERRKMYLDIEKSVCVRIKNALKENGLTENSVAAGDGAVQSRLNSQLKGDSRISLNTILRILDACPNVSADWLLRGSGDMWINNTTVTNSHINKSIVNSDNAVLNDTCVQELIAAKDAIISEKDKRIAEKDEYIALLKSQK